MLCGILFVAVLGGDYQNMKFGLFIGSTTSGRISSGAVDDVFCPKSSQFRHGSEAHVPVIPIDSTQARLADSMSHSAVAHHKKHVSAFGVG